LEKEIPPGVQEGKKRVLEKITSVRGDGQGCPHKLRPSERRDTGGGCTPVFGDVTMRIKTLAKSAKKKRFNDPGRE